MREAHSGPSSAVCPARVKSAIHSLIFGRMSGRHKNLSVSFQSRAEMLRLLSRTSRARQYTSQHTSKANSGFADIAPPPVSHLWLLPPLRIAPWPTENCALPLPRFRNHALRSPLSRIPPTQNLAYSALQPVFPNRAEVFAAQQPAGRALPLRHLVAAKLLFAKVPQLRRNAGLRVMRELGDFIERQPGVALAGAEHHVAQHVALPAPACRGRQACAGSPPLGDTRRGLHFRTSPGFPHACLPSRQLLLVGKLLCDCCKRALVFILVTLFGRPRGAVGIFVISGAGAARAQSFELAASCSPTPSHQNCTHTFSTDFHSRY